MVLPRNSMRSLDFLLALNQFTDTNTRGIPLTAVWSFHYSSVNALPIQIFVTASTHLRFSAKKGAELSLSNHFSEATTTMWYSSFVLYMLFDQFPLEPPARDRNVRWWHNAVSKQEKMCFVSNNYTCTLDTFGTFIDLLGWPLAQWVWLVNSTRNYIRHWVSNPPLKQERALKVGKKGEDFLPLQHEPDIQQCWAHHLFLCPNTSVLQTPAAL